MKTFLLTCIIIFGLPYLLSAQEASNGAIYRTWITLNDNSKTIKGILYEIKDSSVVVTNSSSHYDLLYRNPDLTKIDYNNINIIKNRKKNQAYYSFLGGASIGLVLGALIGYAQGDDTCPAGQWCILRFPAELKAVGGEFLGGIAGAGIGTLIGSVKITIPISGNFEKFNNNKNLLRKYSYIHKIN